MRRIITLLALSILASVPSLQAQSPEEVMRKAYPLLMERYGGDISSQKAHYIFVVDVSSSMRPYETVVRNNFLQFLQSVPDGDQVSLIKMSDENNTDFVELLKCATLNPAIRRSITEVVNGFRFNTQGSPHDGSDGFSMAKRVLEAINVTGSNDLTFVYMLTDFEYWTHRNSYNKNAENWASLEGKLPEGKIEGMCKYGIELNAGSNLHQNAIFKPELDRIFGKVQYQSVASAALLSNWFSHIATSVMSVKLNRMLEKEWNESLGTLNYEIVHDGNDVILKVSGMDIPLVNGADVSAKTLGDSFKVLQQQGDIPGDFKIGEIDIDADSKSFLPGYLTVGGNDCDIEIQFHSPYDQEISRLQGVCGVTGQDGAVSMKLSQSVKQPKSSVWNSFIPLWAWLLIAAILLIILASLLWQFLFTHVDQEWSVSVRGSFPDDVPPVRVNGDGMKARFTVGSGEGDNHVLVKKAPWTLAIEGKKYNPLLFWKKSGYYLVLQKGEFAEVDLNDGSEPVTISVGENCFLFPAGQSGFVRVRIHERGSYDYRIDLS